MKLFFLVLLAFASQSFAANIYVANYGDGTPSTANVQAAHDAASSGDTVIFPVGNATWTGAVTITKALTFQGAGAVVSGGTKITLSGTMTSGAFLITNLTTSTLMRFTAIYFDAVDWTPQYILKLFPTNSVTSLRVDHCVFNQGNVAIEMHGCKGVVDHNDFINQNTSIYYSAGTDAQAAASWVTLAAGSADAMFIETNNFIRNASYGHAGGSNSHTEALNGGKFVIRYNSFDGTGYPLATAYYTVAWHGSQPAGVDPDKGYWQQELGGRRSPSVIEVYWNTMTGAKIDYLASSRGGSALIWNNAVTTSGGGTTEILLREEEYSSSEWSPLRTVWPAEDQVFNTFIWGNTLDGVAMTGANVVVDPNDASPNEKIKLNRDYWLAEPAASGGSESFTGQNGGTNTAPTNGVTYPTLGNMSFSGSGANAYYPYTPYTYPHPLTAGVSGGIAGSASIAGPANIR